MTVDVAEELSRVHDGALRPANLEIKTRSVEQTLIPLITQVFSIPHLASHWSVFHITQSQVFFISHLTSRWSVFHITQSQVFFIPHLKSNWSVFHITQS